MTAKMIGMEGSLAVAEAAKLADVDVVAAYPITPQTHIVERLADMVASGELNANYIPVESEHSAMSACLGSSATGARTFTATAGQGLELMHEVLYVASAMRLPIVMSVANRALSGPLSVWGDHSDVMAVRDVGWIQIFVENAQQAFDNTICAFKIAENQGVLIPVMIHLDGFHLSHVVEPLLLLEQEQVTSFLPPYEHPLALNPEKPVSMGAFAMPYIFTETKKAQDVALKESRKVILDTWSEFGKLFGRHYRPIETYEAEDADTLLIMMGSFSETAMLAVDELRKEGRKVGLVRFRLWRPFPIEELLQATRKATNIVVFDRSLSYGTYVGSVCSEVRAALYAQENRPKVVGFTGGLGGRDVAVSQFIDMVNRGEKADKQAADEIQFIGVRE